MDLNYLFYHQQLLDVRARSAAAPDAERARAAARAARVQCLIERYRRARNAVPFRYEAVRLVRQPGNSQA